MIAAPRSGSGKTTLTIGLLRAYRRAGIRVAGAKCGPDYIDTAFHGAACGRPGVNLDSWAMKPGLIAQLAAEAAKDSDLLICEASMGLFDGVPVQPGRSGSSADVAAALGLPVVLVLDVSAQSQSAGAIVKGFMTFDERVRIAGVVLNRVASERHLRLVSDGISKLAIPILGSLPRSDGIELPERHLGLVQAGETSNLEGKLDAMAEFVARNVRMDELFGCAGSSWRLADRAIPAGLAATGTAHRDRSRRSLLLYLSPYPGRLAQQRRGTANILSARGRASAERLRYLLAARGISGASCRENRRGEPFS